MACSPGSHEWDEPLLPNGIRRRPLLTHADDRGQLTELFREEWDTGVRAVQWNAVRSAPGVLRGVHVHIRHTDHLVLLDGRARILLHDLRQGSPTEGGTYTVELSGDRLEGLTIPPGVGHAFWFESPSLLVYAVSSYWDIEDELGCHWSDPGLGLPPFPQSPQLSARDSTLPPLRILRSQLEPWQPL